MSSLRCHARGVPRADASSADPRCSQTPGRAPVLTFSIFLSYQRIHPPEAYQGQPLFEEKLDEAKLADELGYDLLWLPEHHLIHFMQCPSTLLLATQIGLNVKMRVGTMVSLLTYRHPLVTAGEIAVADQILGGRLELGVGR